MSRSGYSYDYDSWELIRWRGAVHSAIKGKRGQAALRDLLCLMDSMSCKRLIEGKFVHEGEYCTLGLLGAHRGLDVSQFNDDGYADSEMIAQRLGLAQAFVREVMFENDDGAYLTETPDQRWSRMREWVASNIVKEDGGA